MGISSLPVVHLPKIVREEVLVDGFSVDSDPLGDRQEVRRREQARLETAAPLTQQRLAEGARRTLSNNTIACF